LSSSAQKEQEKLTHYILPEFTLGTILMNDESSYEAMVNYNALTEELIFENNGEKLAIDRSEIHRIDTVFINTRRFIPLKGRFLELVSWSSFEIFVEYTCALKEVGKSIGYGQRSKTTSVKNVTSYNADGRLYNLKLPDTFEIDPSVCYWLKRNNEYIQFCNLRDLRKFYKKKIDLFKDYKKSQNVEYENQESMIKLITYLEKG